MIARSGNPPSTTQELMVDFHKLLKGANDKAIAIFSDKEKIMQKGISSSLL
jgi:hypothetical protein